MGTIGGQERTFEVSGLVEYQPGKGLNLSLNTVAFESSWLWLGRWLRVRCWVGEREGGGDADPTG